MLAKSQILHSDSKYHMASRPEARVGYLVVPWIGVVVPTVNLRKNDIRERQLKTLKNIGFCYRLYLNFFRCI